VKNFQPFLINSFFFKKKNINFQIIDLKHSNNIKDNCLILIKKTNKIMAERMGFEPMKELPLYTLSKRAPSTTRPPLQNNLYNILFIFFFIC
jgi:hypothetical protein